MSGHSKWANIKTRKGAQDKKRSSEFTKVAKLILTAIRQGGGKVELEANGFLRVAVEKAREVNMPKENIERLLKSFEERRNHLANFVFEGFGPFGVPLMIETETDNKNRIVGEIRSILKNYEGNLGESGSVAFMFDKVGEVEVKKIEDEMELELIDLGVEDIDGNVLIVSPEKLSEMVDLFKSKGLEVTRQEISHRCKMPMMLQSESNLARVLDLIEELEENEEVVNVWAGFDYAQKT